MNDEERGPRIALRQRSAAGMGLSGNWNVVWEVENRGAQPIQLLAARLPHGQFKSEELRFEPAMELPPGRRKGFQTSVRCHESSGLVTENAFVIFHAIWLDAPWRIFVRIRVVVNAGGRPEAVTESTTSQKIGFSGVAS